MRWVKTRQVVGDVKPRSLVADPAVHDWSTSRPLVETHFSGALVVTHLAFWFQGRPGWLAVLPIPLAGVPEPTARRWVSTNGRFINRQRKVGVHGWANRTSGRSTAGPLRTPHHSQSAIRHSCGETRAGTRPALIPKIPSPSAREGQGEGKTIRHSRFAIRRLALLASRCFSPVTIRNSRFAVFFHSPFATRRLSPLAVFHHSRLPSIRQDRLPTRHPSGREV
jgi:hypothetical protein